MNEQKILELTKDPSLDYYLSAFKRIEETGKSTWNWAAFLGGEMWLNYRKMYMFGVFYFILAAIVSFIFSFSIETFCKSAGFAWTEEIWISIFLIGFLLLPRIILGFFGNKFYYKRVKKNIRKGYHLCDKYKVTSPVMLYFSYNPINPIVALVIWIHDRALLRKTLKSKVSFNNDINEENIKTMVSTKSEHYYLKKFKKIEIGKVISINWAAWLGGTFWFLYRKMYLCGFSLLAINLIFLISCASMFSFPLNEDAFKTLQSSVSCLFQVAVNFIIGFVLWLGGANRLYYNFCLKKSAEEK